MKRVLYSLITLSLVSLVLFLSYGIAAAHGKTAVGDYDLEIGFHNEPVIQNQPNSLDLFVTNSKTNQPVNGLESTLKAELIFGPNTKAMEISPMDGVDGGYTAFVIPTMIGDYTWRISGNIENTPVDVSMTSSPTTFGSVEAATDYLFPPVVANPQGTAISAQTMMVIGIAGAVLGLIGLIVAIVSLSTARRSGAPKSAPKPF